MSRHATDPVKLALQAALAHAKRRLIDTTGTTASSQAYADVIAITRVIALTTEEGYLDDST